ncbi:MAG: hypothetical protein ACR2RD_10105 [Woeseiaceae bacterium]
MRLILAFSLTLLLSACIVHRLDVKPVDVTTADPIVVSTPVKAHLEDGSTVVFPDGVSIANGVVSGDGTIYNLTLENRSLVSEISLADVAAMESYQTPVSTGATTAATAASSTGILIGGMAALFLIFGSCPTVYSFDGDGAALEAELFSYSITPSFQSRDIDRLDIRSIDNGSFELEVRNEMLETHYIDQLQVLEIVHNDDERVYPDQNGRPVVVRELLAPTTAVDQTGRDILVGLRDVDNLAWSASDDRLASVTADDYLDKLDFEFEVPSNADNVALVLRARNSLLNTVLFYDVMLKEQSFGALDWMGHDLGHLGNKMQLGLWYRKHMGMTISVWDNGRYRKVARLGDQGPIAWNEHAVLLPTKGAETLRVRLSFVADNWRLDRVAAATNATRARARSVPIAAARSADGERGDIPAYLNKADKEYLIAEPRDRVSLRFDVGEVPDDRDRTFFLASEGYYMEWMRADWLTEEHRTTFEPGTDALIRAIALYAEKRDTFREQFEATKLVVR